MEITAEGYSRSMSASIVMALLALIPGIVWWLGVGDLPAYFSHHLPAGQLLYLFSKLFGLYAYFFMTLQIVIGIQGRGSRYFAYHPRIGMLTTVTVLAHMSFFIIAASQRSGHATIDTLVPTFDQGYYKSFVSVGVVSAYCMLLVVLVTLFQRRFPRVFRIVHRTAFLVAGLGWLHAFSIGTETRIPVVMGFYACLLGWAICQLVAKMAKRGGRFISGTPVEAENLKKC